MAASRDIMTFFYVIAIPVALAMLWATLSFLAPDVVWVLLFIATLQLPVRIALVASAGYLVARRTKWGLLGASIAGAVVFFADHVIVKGLGFIAMNELGAAVGVVISYLMFFWVAMIVGYIGGWVGARRREDAAI